MKITRAALVAFSAVLMLSFQNCSGSMRAKAASSGAAQAIPASQILTIASSTSILTPNGTIQFTATGGTEPYTYTIYSGGGSIDSTTGSYTASADATSVTVGATDAIGNWGYVTISGSSSDLDSTVDEMSCEPVVLTSSQTCSGAKNGTCSVSIDISSQIPSACTIKSMRVYAKHFNSQSGNCSTDAELAFDSSTTLTSGGGGSKFARLEGTASLSARSLKLTSTVSGWGECGGNPCNACISNVRYELILE